MSTPDGFHVHSLTEVDDYELKLYDRWGVLVWESTDINDYWVPIDTIEKKIETGVFIWVINYCQLIDQDLDGVFEESTIQVMGNTLYLN